MRFLKHFFLVSSSLWWDDGKLYANNLKDALLGIILVNILISMLMPEKSLYAVTRGRRKPVSRTKHTKYLKNEKTCKKTPLLTWNENGRQVKYKIHSKLKWRGYWCCWLWKLLYEQKKRFLHFFHVSHFLGFPKHFLTLGSSFQLA